MTVKDYISQKLAAFGLTDAYYADVILSAGIEVEEPYTDENADSVGKAMISIIEELVFSPRLSNINESGFSASWDFSGLAGWYRLLCRRYGVTPDSDTLAQLGVSSITDMSSIW